MEVRKSKQTANKSLGASILLLFSSLHSSKYLSKESQRYMRTTFYSTGIACSFLSMKVLIPGSTVA